MGCKTDQNGSRKAKGCVGEVKGGLSFLRKKIPEGPSEWGPLDPIHRHPPPPVSSPLLRSVKVASERRREEKKVPFLIYEETEDWICIISPNSHSEAWALILVGEQRSLGKSRM